ncbi:hypothetical protein SERLA73DRAFT_173350 [Serpula lacrymans var. lacrymans S7.3]|uniref:Uncharacterized protein n=2 Tax=Serpula lacrymans var. lacrymans TaxID=341189 RepID=F8QIU7_SERL3|nr:uncharacterized protein SERLADRAFT_446274 [Serpula lacrymans var. lacrymans S7.9]EGN91775.1 hypothetical protein SERLA73DRAFT_173350 [Serpula lacrymans var. lacrymans S7.3]EGO28917.1 hypothetical protein SERLADRAFT_446274 [Serpula lacrymans var. lacrymans S7.9]
MGGDCGAPIVVFCDTLIQQVAATNFNTCISELKLNNQSTYGGLDNNRQSVPMANATAITYELCRVACGTAQEPFTWTNFSQQFSAWLLPYLALISQLPFGAKHRLDNLMSVFLTVGSPALAGYSLVLTVLNARWVTRRFEAVSYPNKGYAVRILNGLQHAPLRIASEDSLLSSLVLLPHNDDWWCELADYLDYTHTWSISAATSIVWVIVAFIFTVVDSLGNVSDNINSNGQAVGSIWLWLLPIVIGWLQLSPKCDSARLRIAITRANAIAFVASDHGVVKASAISNRRAVSIDALSEGSLSSADEDRSPPIYNYARSLHWSHSAEEVLTAFHMASKNASAHRPVDPGVLWQEGDKGNDIHPDNRVGSPEAVDAYCQLPQYTIRSRWAAGVFSRMAIASLISLVMQWGTTGAAIIVVWFTPTIGLGCRSGSFVLYGVLSTLVWIMLVTSSILVHYSSYSQQSLSARLAALGAKQLNWMGKFVAIFNSVWIVAICVFQFSNVFDTCYCNSSVLGLGKNAFDVITLSAQELGIIRGSWIGGLVMASVCSIGFISLMNLLVDPSN